MEQKRPADIFMDALGYLWDGLDLGEKGWKRLKKDDFKKIKKSLSLEKKEERKNEW